MATLPWEYNKSQPMIHSKWENCMICVSVKPFKNESKGTATASGSWQPGLRVTARKKTQTEESAGKREADITVEPLPVMESSKLEEAKKACPRSLAGEWSCCHLAFRLRILLPALWEYVSVLSCCSSGTLLWNLWNIIEYWQSARCIGLESAFTI